MLWLPARKTAEIIVGAASVTVRLEGVGDRKFELRTNEVDQWADFRSGIEKGQSAIVSLTPSAYVLHVSVIPEALKDESEARAVCKAEVERLGISFDSYEWVRSDRCQQSGSLFVGVELGILRVVLSELRRAGARIVRVQALLPCLGDRSSELEAPHMAVLTGIDGSFAWVVAGRTGCIDAGVSSGQTLADRGESEPEIRRLAMGRGIPLELVSTSCVSSDTARFDVVRFGPDQVQWRRAAFVAIGMLCLVLSAFAAVRAHGQLGAIRVAVAQAEFDRQSARQQAVRMREAANASGPASVAVSKMLELRRVAWSDIILLLEQLGGQVGRVEKFSFDAEVMIGEVRLVSSADASLPAPSRLVAGAAIAELSKQELVENAKLLVYVIRLGPTPEDSTERLERTR